MNNAVDAACTNTLAGLTPYTTMLYTPDEEEAGEEAEEAAPPPPNEDQIQVLRGSDAPPEDVVSPEDEAILDSFDGDATTPTALLANWMADTVTQVSEAFRWLASTP
jgi:hypothetical protein